MTKEATPNRGFLCSILVCSILIVPQVSIAFDTVQSGVRYCKFASQDRSPVNDDDFYGAGKCTGVAEGVVMTLSYNCYFLQEGLLQGKTFAAGVVPSTGAAIQAYLNWADGNLTEWGKRFSDGMVAAVSSTFPCESNKS